MSSVTPLTQYLRDSSNYLWYDPDTFSLPPHLGSSDTFETGGVSPRHPPPGMEYEGGDDMSRGRKVGRIVVSHPSSGTAVGHLLSPLPWLCPGDTVFDGTLTLCSDLE